MQHDWRHHRSQQIRADGHAQEDNEDSPRHAQEDNEDSLMITGLEKGGVYRQAKETLKAEETGRECDPVDS